VRAPMAEVCGSAAGAAIDGCDPPHPASSDAHTVILKAKRLRRKALIFRASLSAPCIRCWLLGDLVASLPCCMSAAAGKIRMAPVLARLATRPIKKEPYRIRLFSFLRMLDSNQRPAIGSTRRRFHSRRKSIRCACRRQRWSRRACRSRRSSSRKGTHHLSHCRSCAIFSPPRSTD
jgi:hypothetical protein